MTASIIAVSPSGLADALRRVKPGTFVYLPYYSPIEYDRLHNASRVRGVQHFGMPYDRWIERHKQILNAIRDAGHVPMPMAITYNQVMDRATTTGQPWDVAAGAVAMIMGRAITHSEHDDGGTSNN